MKTKAEFSDWYDSLPYGEPSYQETYEAGYQAGVDSVRYEGELPPVPVGDRFKNNLKFRPLGTGGGDALYEVWGDAIKDYARQAIAVAKVGQSEPVWFHKLGIHGEHRFYDQTETQPEGCTPLYATPQPAPAAQPDAQLCKFYDVATYPELVACMERHIRKLQAKLPISDVIAIQRVREG